MNVVAPRALYSLSYGVYLVSSVNEDGRFNGQIANSAIQVSAEPPTIAVSIHRENLTGEYIERSGVFSLSVLDQTVPMLFIGPFGFKCGRSVDKFVDCRYKVGSTGAPMVLDYSVATMEAKVISVMEVHTHRIFVGEIVGATVVGDGEPLTYAQYHTVKKGKSPANAPTHAFNEVPR
ncbi:MAG: flavin reductase family protein [Synergistota bacterium]|nr:flavin reductase family protein [Synergistota bacterium]